MKKLYFIVGSQDLYGEECLKQVAEDSRQMVAFLNEKVGDLAEIELLPTVETSEICIQDMRKASNDDDCVALSHGCTPSFPCKNVDQRSAGIKKTAASFTYTGK